LSACSTSVARHLAPLVEPHATGEPLQEHRVTKLVRPVVVRIQLTVYSSERRVIDERPQQFVVTRTWFVHSGEHRVDDAEPAVGTKSVGRETCSASHDSVGRCGVFQRSNDGRSDGHYPSAAIAGIGNGRRGRCGDAVRFVERQQPVK
jgi:hypothetical protein